MAAPAEPRVDLVFEGGGVKGIALVGALSVLEEAGYVPVRRAGASAGAMVAALSAAGYSALEMRDIVKQFPFDSLLDKGWEDRIPLFGKYVLSMVRDHGAYEGDKLHRWIEGLLAEQGVRNFGDLVTDPDAPPRRRYGLQVIVSDVTDRRLLVLPADAERLGFDPDGLDVAMAVRASTSIPIFFEPVQLTNPRTGRTHVLVDGGMLSNFPVWLFDSDGVPSWPTFGLDLASETTGDAGGDPRFLDPTHLLGFLWGLISTMIEAHDRLELERTSAVRTISIPTLGIGTTDFQEANERADDLYESGRGAARDFLAKWDFDEYRRAFRVPSAGPPATSAAGSPERSEVPESDPDDEFPPRPPA